MIPQPQLKLIGLTGQAGCGKDTVANFLFNTQEFRILSLAAPIRRGIAAAFNIPMHYMTDRQLKEQPLDQLCGKSPRYAMQTLGTEWGRNQICLDVWLKVAQADIDYHQRLVAANNLYLNGIVVSDIRFEGEAKWLRDQGGTIWHIRRTDNPHAINTGHASEGKVMPLNGEPFIINDGDIDQLHDQISLFMDSNIFRSQEPARSFTGDCT